MIGLTTSAARVKVALGLGPSERSASFIDSPPQSGHRLAPLVLASVLIGSEAWACSYHMTPSVDRLAEAEVVAWVRLIEVRTGPSFVGGDTLLDHGPTALLTLETSDTLKGSHKDVWFVIWRGGSTALVAPRDAEPLITSESHEQVFIYERDGSIHRTTLKLGEEYFAGIAPAGHQSDFDELHDGGCDGAVPYMFAWTPEQSVQLYQKLTNQ